MRRQRESLHTLQGGIVRKGAVFSRHRHMLLGEKLSAAGIAGAAIILACVTASVLMSGTER